MRWHGPKTMRPLCAWGIPEAGPNDAGMCSICSACLPLAHVLRLPMLRALSVGLSLLSVAFVAQAARAQQPLPGSHVQTLQSVSAGVFLMDFRYAGDVDAPVRFDYTWPAYGLLYMRPNLLATAALGVLARDQQEGDLGMFDVSLTTWRALLAAGVAGGTTRLHMPIVLAASHRRVLLMQARDEEFNATTLGIGIGGAVERAAGNRVFLVARVHPVIEFATTTLTDGYGLSYQIDGLAECHITDLLGEYGLSIGYLARYKVWNINASAIFQDTVDEIYDYTGFQQVLILGINF